MRERLAGLCHEQWAGWMKYMFDKSTRNSDGTITIPKWAVDRWTLQMNKAYAELTEQERDSDRDEANRVIELLKGLGYL